MEIFERVLLAIQHKGATKAWLANELGIPKPTFNGWFSTDKQERLVPKLYAIHNLWPDISREWLFFGEGNMYAEDKKPTEKEQALKRENDELRSINIKLTKMLFQSGDPGDTAN